MHYGGSAGQKAQRLRAQAERLRTQAQELLERAERAERDADKWDRGRAGEQTVGEQLELLRPHGFDVLHDVRWPGRQRANIDHVAIGPPGILVVDAKNWSGKITVRGGLLRRNGYQQARQVDGVRRAGQHVGELLQLPWALHVIPVMAMASGSAGVHRCGDVTVVGHGDLVAWTTGLPPQLTPGDVLGVASNLRSALPPASVPRPRVRPKSGMRRPPRELSARQRRRAARRAAASREALVKLSVVLLLIVAGPSLLRWWGANGSEVVGAVFPEPTVSLVEPTPAPSPLVFADCKAMRVQFPNGVRRPAAAQTAKKRRAAVVDNAVYRANAGLDRDRDGVVCGSKRVKGTNKR